MGLLSFFCTRLEMYGLLGKERFEPAHTCCKPEPRNSLRSDNRGSRRLAALFAYRLSAHTPRRPYTSSRLGKLLKLGTLFGRGFIRL